MDDFRKLLHRAQDAERNGDAAEAAACLRLAAALCREAGLEAKAQKMLRHLSRLEARAPSSSASGVEKAGASPAPSPVCALCMGEAAKGWQGESGRWICGKCLKRAKAAPGGLS